MCSASIDEVVILFEKVYAFRDACLCTLASLRTTWI